MVYKSRLLLTSLLVCAAGAATAADTWPAQSRYLKMVTAMLTTEGYTSIEAVNGDELHLSANDTLGRSVRLTMHPDNGTVDAVKVLPEWLN